MHWSIELVSCPVDKLAACRNSSSISEIDLVVNILVHCDALCSIMNILIAGWLKHYSFCFILASLTRAGIPQSFVLFYFHCLCLLVDLTCDISFHCPPEILQLLRHVHERGGDPVRSSENSRCSAPDRKGYPSPDRWGNTTAQIYIWVLSPSAGHQSELQL